MKESYIKQVKRALKLSRKARKEVVRDLQEIFASALEHGETEEQVMQRLGTPNAFACRTAEQYGVDLAARKKRNAIRFSVAALILAVAAFVLYAAIQLEKVPDGAIGQADAMTNIQVVGRLGFDASNIILAVGVVALFTAGVQCIRAIGRTGADE